MRDTFLSISISISDLVVAGFMSLLIVGCDKGGDVPPTQGQAATSTGAKVPPAGLSSHAGRGVRSGSHEDWCGEHEVPESLCTRCNPSLAAAFKVTGDWCEEHGLPESQCRICNPDLEIKRPPRSGDGR